MKTSACLASLTLIAAALSGCANGDLTPELAGTANRHADSTNNYEVTNNVNVRGISDDFDRLFFLDSPMSISPYPIVRTSGDPH